jgi:integrase
MKINFYLRDIQTGVPEKKQTETSIILFATHANGRLKYYTKLYIKPSGWDFDKQVCKKNVAHNTTLDTIKRKLNDAHAKLIEQGTRVTNQSLKTALLIELKRDKEGNETQEPSEPAIETLYTLLNRFIDVRSGLRARGTMQRYTALKTHLLGYEDKHKTNVKLSELNAEFADAFASFLYSKGHQRNTVGKLFIGLKVVLNWAVGSGYPIPPHYKKFPIPSAPTKIIALNETELMQFAMVPLPPGEQITRDLFVFSAYTGLRYSDCVRITPEMINGNWLTITTKKTEEPLRVYLMPEAKDILAKYKNRLKGLRTNQGTNKGIKRIAKLAGITQRVKFTEYYGNETTDHTVEKWKVLTFHSAKKTHVTLQLKYGTRPEVLSAQIGNTMRTLKPYILIADQDKETAISKAFKEVKKVGTQLRKTA